MTTTTARRFGMHPNLLMHVIQRQAGTLAKAVLEGVMNSVDAGATRCDLTLDATTLTITDDGKGFVDMTEVENYFEQFGTPHEAGDAHYGQFRLGRGQLFCFGANAWRSHSFAMEVDIKATGLDYTLDTQADHVTGCDITVQLYDALVPSELRRVIKEVKEFVHYMPILVMLNDEQINVDPATEEWDFETDDAWFRLKSSGPSMLVYNLGALAERVNTWGLGSAGVVVSKRQLKLNMARNQIDSKCPVWKRIREKIKAESRDCTKDKRRQLTDAERGMLANDLMDGTGDVRELFDAKLLTDVRGRTLSINTLFRRPEPFAVAPRGDRAGEHALNAKTATVLAEETLERFGVATLPELLEKVATIAQQEGLTWMGDKFRRLAKGVVSAESLREQVAEGYDPIPDSKLNKLEKAALQSLRQGAIKLYEGIVAAGVIEPGPRRDIRVGSSVVADAWTDGARYIFIERGNLKRLQKGISGAFWLMRLLVHEYIHSDADNGSHNHDFDFLDAYHELMLHNDADDWIGIAAERTMRSFVSRLESAGRRPNKAALEALDHDAILANMAAKAKEHTEALAANAEEVAKDVTASEPKGAKAAKSKSKRKASKRKTSK